MHLPNAYGSETEMDQNDGKKSSKTTVIEKKSHDGDESVHVNIPGVGNLCLRGQYGVTIAGIVILSLFLVERMYSLSLCLAQQNRAERLRDR